MVSGIQACDAFLTWRDKTNAPPEQDLGLRNVRWRDGKMVGQMCGSLSEHMEV